MLLLGYWDTELSLSVSLCFLITNEGNKLFPLHAVAMVSCVTTGSKQQRQVKPGPREAFSLYKVFILRIFVSDEKLTGAPSLPCLTS